MSTRRPGPLASLFFGQWGIYAFESETIVASDINNGLMVMRLGG